MKKFKFKVPALTVRGRLYGVLGLLTLMLLGGAAVGLGAMHFQNEGMRQIYEEELAPSETLCAQSKEEDDRRSADERTAETEDCAVPILV